MKKGAILVASVGFLLLTNRKVVQHIRHFFRDHYDDRPPIRVRNGGSISVTTCGGDFVDTAGGWYHQSLGNAPSRLLVTVVGAPTWTHAAPVCAQGPVLILFGPPNSNASAWRQMTVELRSSPTVPGLDSLHLLTGQPSFNTRRRRGIVAYRQNAVMRRVVVNGEKYDFDDDHSLAEIEIAQAS